jgi:hypothetical protein
VTCSHHRSHCSGNFDLEAVPVVGGPFQAEPGGESFLQMLGDDRADRADMLVVTQGISWRQLVRLIP